MECKSTGWSLTTLGEVADFINGDRGKNYPSSLDRVETGIPFINTGHIEPTGWLSGDRMDYITEEKYNKLGSGKVDVGDIVYCLRGSTIGKTARNKYSQGAIASSLIIVRAKEQINQDFLYYFLISPEGQSLAKSNDNGSAQPNLSGKVLAQYPIKIPKYDEQCKVVNILNSLDAKIQSNNQTNQTLEQMAQALFKSWFVDFDPVFDNALASGMAVNDFPEALQKKALLRQQQRQQEPLVGQMQQQIANGEPSADKKDEAKPLPEDIRQFFPSDFEQTHVPSIGINGWIPKGWGISNVDEACSHIIDHRGKTPKKLGGDWADNGFSAISAKNIKDNKIVRPDTIRFVDDGLYAKWMKEPLQAKDIIMTSEAPMGEMFFLAEKADYLLSQRLYGMRADKDKTTGEYLNYWLQTVTAKADLEGRSTGTTVTGIRQVELKKVAVLLPDLTLTKKFSDIAGEYLLQKERNNNQSNSLEELRDTLLPKLISGELTLPVDNSTATAAIEAYPS